MSTAEERRPKSNRRVFHRVSGACDDDRCHECHQSSCTCPHHDELEESSR